MLDLLAAIQSVDPPSLVLWGLALFAAGMYPVGFMLGASCSPCCNANPCSACTAGNLPDTVTVTLSGWQDGAAQGPDLIQVTVNSDFGSGGEVKITSPGDTPGPITGATVTSGGDGYARIARVAPTVTASVTGGAAASLSVTLSQTTDNAWQGDGRAVWQVESVAVSAGGTGYTDWQAVTFTAGTGSTTLAGASGAVRTNRVQPTVTAAITSGTGSGATLGVTLTQTTDWNGDTVWSVSALSITAAGSGYQVGDQIQVAVTDGVQPFWDSFYAEVAAVDGSGAVTAVAIYYGGEYYKSGGVIESVVIYDGGTYYKEDPAAPAEVASLSFIIQQFGPQHALAGGASLSAVVDTNTASATFGKITGLTITNGGSGYLAWQTYNADCCEDYYNGLTLVLKRNTGLTNGSHPLQCQYYHRICGTAAWADSEYWEPFLTAGVYVFYSGPNAPPVVRVATSGSCGAEMTSTTNISDCDEFSFTATDVNGRTAVVTAGGEYDPEYKAGGWENCFSCCRGEDEAPPEVEVEVWSTNAFTNEESDRVSIVLQRSGGGVIAGPPVYAFSTGRWITPSAAFVAGAPMVHLWIQPCRSLQDGCNECWDNCNAMAQVQPFFGQQGAWTLFFHSKQCVGCSDGPVCAPPTGLITMDQIFSPSGNVVSWSQWALEVL